MTFLRKTSPTSHWFAFPTEKIEREKISRRWHLKRIDTRKKEENEKANALLPLEIPEMQFPVRSFCLTGRKVISCNRAVNVGQGRFQDASS